MLLHRNKTFLGHHKETNRIRIRRVPQEKPDFHVMSAEIKVIIP